MEIEYERKARLMKMRWAGIDRVTMGTKGRLASEYAFAYREETFSVR